MMLVDSHAHLDDEAFESDRAEVVARAEAAGVTAIVAVGTTADSSDAALRLAGQFPIVHAAVGIQPNCCAAAAPGDWNRIVALAREPGVVALGETGLDRYWNDTPLDVQEDYFDRHLRLSAETELPVVIHLRDSEADILRMLEEAHRRDGSVRGVMHSFTGTAKAAVRCVELGLYISFAGMVTFKKSGDLRAVARAIPGDRILVETDSPYLSPEPVRKIRRNEPAHVAHTAACLAEVRGVPAAAFAEQTTANARRLFGLGIE
jgi:TatD DNase family protein